MASKAYDFVITLRQHNNKTADIFGLLLSILPLVYFFRLYIETAQTLFLISTGLIMLLLLYNWLRWLKGKAIVFRFIFGLIAITFIIIKSEYNTFLLAVLYFVLIFAEAQYKRVREHGFDENGVADNAWGKSFVPWTEIKNVLIKDGLLTIDYKNNKLVQKEIDGEVSEHTVAEFNTFCAKQIAQSTQ